MIKHPLNLLYYIAFSLTVGTRLCRSSTLISLPQPVTRVTILVTAALFLMKFLLERHRFRDYIWVSLAAAVFTYVFLVTDTPILLIGFLAFISIKGTDIRKIIMIDAAIKSIFLVTHASLYLLDYIFSIDMATESVVISGKGVSHSLYFVNPNTVGLIVTWLMIDILYLRRNSSIKNVLACLPVAIICFMVTKSRTAFFAFIIYLALGLVKKRKAIRVLYALAFPLLAILSLAIVTLVPIGGEFYNFFDQILSGRLWYSISAYSEFGMHVLPAEISKDFFDMYIVDNFYIRCFISYGLVTLFLSYIPYLLTIKNEDAEIKRIGVTASVYLFFEAILIDIGFAPYYLLLSDSIINKPKERNSHEK